MRWIVRGLLHLILYRFVYLHLAGDPAELVTLGDLRAVPARTFLLYLRVSGQFHLIVGVLHLYGFRLPETHHLYYLASSFTDFWRRINIYWKDFMMKLVYYPSYFRLRRWGGNTALVGRHGDRFLGHLDAPFLPVVLAAWRLSAGAAGCTVLGDIWVRWWCSARYVR